MSIEVCHSMQNVMTIFVSRYKLHIQVSLPRGSTSPPEILQSCCSFLQDALLQNTSSVQSLFRSLSADRHLDDVQLSLSGVPGPYEVARLLALWMASAPRVEVPLELQKSILKGDMDGSKMQVSYPRMKS